jgi:hypothetical protein
MDENLRLKKMLQEEESSDQFLHLRAQIKTRELELIPLKNHLQDPKLDRVQTIDNRLFLIDTKLDNFTRQLVEIVVFAKSMQMDIDSMIEVLPMNNEELKELTLQSVHWKYIYETGLWLIRSLTDAQLVFTKIGDRWCPRSKTTRFQSSTDTAKKDISSNKPDESENMDLKKSTHSSSASMSSNAMNVSKEKHSNAKPKS